MHQEKSPLLNRDLTPAKQIAEWADNLRSMSANGVKYASNIYDRDHYTQIQEIAKGMLALATGNQLEDLKPLLDPLFLRPGPVPCVDAAIINEEGQILLIQRADTARWAMPGGGIDVGETPAEGAAREALEETGVHCEPIRLIGVHDNRLCGGTNPMHLYLFMFLCRLLPMPSETPSHANETLGMGWFSENQLPQNLEPSHAVRISIAFHAWQGEMKAYFD